MRADRPRDRITGRVLAMATVLAGAALGALAGGVTGVSAGLLVGIFLALGLYRRLGRRWARRRALLATPFPDAWRTFLLDRYDHFDRLSSDERRRFEDDLRLFLLETRITGVEVEVTDELRVLVAASAVTLSLGWPDYEWDQLTEVLLYPEAFDRDWRFRGDGERDPESDDDLVGQAHPWGTVILSVPSLLESFDDPDDAFHVGLHEFAHLLDMDQSHFDGIPVGLAERDVPAWVQVAARERERLQTEEAERDRPSRPRRRRGPRGRRPEPRRESVFDPYGADDPVEFLAVAVEAFFEASLAVRQEHPEVYRILAGYFRQDPAAGDDARGLTLEE
jgi:hypothetical protein